MSVAVVRLCCLVFSSRLVLLPFTACFLRHSKRLGELDESALRIARSTDPFLFPFHTFTREFGRDEEVHTCCCRRVPASSESVFDQFRQRVSTPFRSGRRVDQGLRDCSASDSRSTGLGLIFDRSAEARDPRFSAPGHQRIKSCRVQQSVNPGNGAMETCDQLITWRSDSALSPGSSKLARQWHFIRAELPSNGCPRPSGSPPFSAPISITSAFCECVRRGQHSHTTVSGPVGRFPRQARPPFLCHALLPAFSCVRGWCGRFRYHPPSPAESPPRARSPRGEQVRVRYVDVGPWRWIPLGVEVPFKSTITVPGLLSYRHEFLTRYVSYAPDDRYFDRARRADARRRWRCLHVRFCARTHLPCP